MPEDYENEYRSDLREMLEAKLAGKEITAPEPGHDRAGRRPHGRAEAERRAGPEEQDKPPRRAKAEEKAARSASAAPPR